MSDNVHTLNQATERLNRIAEHWMGGKNLDHIRVLARIDSISHMDTEPTKEVEEGIVSLGGYQTNWQVTALSNIGVFSRLYMYSPHKTRDEFEKACGWVREGQYWIVDGELDITPVPPPNNQGGFHLLIVWPKFTAIPAHLLPAIDSLYKRC